LRSGIPAKPDHRDSTRSAVIKSVPAKPDHRHPQCGGARRADWLDKTSQLLLPKVNYFQVVFTLPYVLKYLARYMTGGPISDRRIISDAASKVTFWARSKEKATGNQSQPFSLQGREFVRRWAMHILPKGYTRSRSYGGYMERNGTPI
jgi:hypothetical protein